MFNSSLCTAALLKTHSDIHITRTLSSTMPESEAQDKHYVLALSVRLCVPVRTSIYVRVHSQRACRRFFMLPALRRHFGIARSIRLSVPWRSCLGCRHAGCLQLSHRRPPEMCGLRMDVDPPRFLDQAAIGGGHIVSPQTGRYLLLNIFKYAKYGFCGRLSCCAGFLGHSC